MTIAIITICTGPYNVFIQQFVQSSIKNFFPNAMYRHWYIFTDTVVNNMPKNVSCLYAKHEDWPFVALKKFHYIMTIANELSKYDYVFLINANTVFYKSILVGQIGTDGCKQLIAYKHVWPYCKAVKDQQTFNRLLDLKTESNIKSMAYIGIRPYIYCQSAFIGGMSTPFICMCKKLKNMTDTDLRNHIIPVWHDESYVNKYIVNNFDKFVFLSEKIAIHENLAGYTCNKILKHIASIMFLDKEKMFDLYSFKNRNVLNASNQCIFIDGQDSNWKTKIIDMASSLKENNNCQFSITKNIDFDLLINLLDNLGVSNYYIQTTNKDSFNNKIAIL